MQFSAHLVNFLPRFLDIFLGLLNEKCLFLLDLLHRLAQIRLKRVVLLEQFFYLVLKRLNLLQSRLDLKHVILNFLLEKVQLARLVLHVHLLLRL